MHLSGGRSGALKQQLKGVWRVIGPYWMSEDRWSARGLLALIFAIDMLIVYRIARQTYWQKDFFDALAAYNTAAFWNLLVQLTVLLTIGVTLNTIRIYVFQHLEFRWRSWMTDVFTRRWLSNNAYLHTERERRIDNADQRIAEDLRLVASKTLTLTLGLFSNFAELATYAVIVWTLSGAVSFVLAGNEFTIPGFMFYAAVLYAIVGSVMMERIARKLVDVDYRQQKAEADFRYALVRVRDNAEQIAFYQGHETEQSRLRRTFASIQSNWRQVMTYTKRVTITDGLYNEGGTLLPYLMIGPRYLQGGVTLGGMTQFSQAFMRLRWALSWFISEYKELALLRSVVRRLTEFDASLDSVPQQGITISREGNAALLSRELQLSLPSGETLVGPLDLSIRPGERWLVRGPSGAGKTTLMRALADLWPHGSGDIEWPAAARTMFVPQQSYLPIGTLRSCLCYPRDATEFDTEECVDVLRAVRLEHLIDRLDDDDNWSKRLSPGEQQRLAIARVLLSRPTFLLVDEATSALDSENESNLYGLLLARLPDLTLVSVGHHPTLQKFHTHVLTLAFSTDSGSEPGRSQSQELVMT